MEQIPPGVSFSDEELMGVIERQIQGQARENDLRLEVKKSLRRQIYNAIRKMDVLQDLLEDEDITEIMVNGPSSIFVEKDEGSRRRTENLNLWSGWTILPSRLPPEETGS